MEMKKDIIRVLVEWGKNNNFTRLAECFFFEETFSSCNFATEN